MKKFLFNSTACFAPVDAVARAALRDKIPVTVIKKVEGSKEEENNNENDGENNNKQEQQEQQEQQQQENNEQIEKNEKTAEELAAEQAAATNQKDKDRIQKRIDRLTAKNKELEAKNAELEQQLAAKPREGLTEEEVERRSNEKADQKAAERQFANDCNKLFTDATKVDKEFKKKIDDLVDELGGVQVAGIPGQMIGILSDIDNGGAILAYLANDVDLYEEVRALPMSRMANRLNKLGFELEETVKKAEEAKKKSKEPSRVPAPVQPIRGNNASPDTYTQNMSMDAYVTMRGKQKKDREERRKAGLRG